MEKNYKVTTNILEVLDYINGATVVAFDFETSPRDECRYEVSASIDPHRSEITAMSISVKPGTAIMIPLRHRNNSNMNIYVFEMLLKSLLENDKITKIAHNLSFESAFSYAKGIVIKPPVYDTMAAAQLTLKSDYEFRGLKDSGLKLLAKELCGETLQSFESLTRNGFFDELDPLDKDTINYSCADADIALQLYFIFNKWFEKYMPAHRYITEKVESPTSVYLGIMRYNGIPFDISETNSKRITATERIEMLAEKIKKFTGNINIGTNCNNTSFRKFIFENCGLPGLKMTERGAKSLDDEALILLKEWCEVNKPELTELFSLVQEYRKLQKIKSTYLDGYGNHINYVTNSIHPSFMSQATDTGRFSCTSPNVQNIPRKTNDPVGIRALIKAPENCVIISCDYSQIELRVGAFYSGDKKMIETYMRNGDIHAETTKIIFGISDEEATDKNNELYKERRTIAKNVNFGTFYGLYPKGLQNTLKFKAGKNLSIDECKKIISNLKTGYPGITRWQQNAKREACEKMYTSSWLGRRRYLPDIRSDDWLKKSFAERCALNTPVQGTAADIIKIAMARMLNVLSENDWLKPIMQVHDELVFIAPEDKSREAVALIKKVMELKPFEAFNVPVVAEASIGSDYANMKEV